MEISLYIEPGGVFTKQDVHEIGYAEFVFQHKDNEMKSPFAKVWYKDGKIQQIELLNIEKGMSLIVNGSEVK